MTDKGELRMKKIRKGNAGYLDYKKKTEILWVIVWVVIIAGLLLAGYITTGSRENLLTILAIVCCLPAARVLVSVITRWKYHSVSEDLAREITEKTTHLTTVFDLVLTSEDKIMPVTCIVISGDKVFGYISDKKTDLKYTTNHIWTMLRTNGFTSVTVKLFDQYSAFLARAEGLDNIQAVEQNDTKEHEESIRRLLLNISL